jgi:hypothetical protein
MISHLTSLRQPPACPRDGQPAAAARVHGGSFLACTPPAAAPHRSRALPPLRAAAEPPYDVEALEPAGGGGGAAPEVDARRQGYRSFQLESCEFLVAETPEGLLDLSDAFIVDAHAQSSGDRGGGGGAFERAPADDGIPAGPARYQEAEWGSSYSGNVLDGSAPKRWVFKVYLVPVLSADPYQLDLSRAYCVDGATRGLRRCDVRWLAPRDADPRDLRLRIREGKLTVDTAQSLPGPERVVVAAQQGVPAVSDLEAALAAAGGPGAEEAVGSAPAGGGGPRGVDEAQAAEDLRGGGDDVLYDDDTLRDFLVEVDDENDEIEYDMPGADY